MYRSAARLDLQLVLRRRVAMSNLTAVDVATQADRYADLGSRSRQPGAPRVVLPLKIGADVVNDGGCFPPFADANTFLRRDTFHCEETPETLSRLDFEPRDHLPAKPQLTTR